MKTTQRIALMIGLALVGSTIGTSPVWAQAMAPSQDATPQEPKSEEAKADITSDIELTRAVMQIKRQATDKLQRHSGKPRPSSTLTYSDGEGL